MLTNLNLAEAASRLVSAIRQPPTAPPQELSSLLGWGA
jgi:hypothetical protein